MNILYVVDMLTVLGGCELHTLTLAREMSKTNNISILTNHFNKDFDKMLGNSDLYVGFNDENYRKFCDKNIKIVHSCPFTSVEIGHTLSKKLNARHIITVHGNNTSGLTPDIIGASEKVIFTSELFKQDVMDLVPESKSLVIPTPIDTFTFKEKTVRAKKIKGLLNPKFKTLVVSSRIDYGKEIPMFQLLNIAPALAEKLGGINILFIGDGNKLLDILERSIGLCSDSLNINILGQVEDVSNYLNIADLVLASDRCAIEAILCNKPVFYMGKEWKELIKKDNYYKLLFTNECSKTYEDSEITKKLIALLRSNNKKIDKELSIEIGNLCDSSIIAEKMELLYK